MAIPQPRPEPCEAAVTFRGPVPRTLRERDEEAIRLKQRFRAVSRRIERREAPRRLWNRHKGWLATAAVAIALGAAYAASLHTGWPVAVALKHAASFPNCAAARSMGLAPARRGEPGYWPS